MFSKANVKNGQTKEKGLSLPILIIAFVILALVQKQNNGGNSGNLAGSSFI
jgi:hypothetical protein